MPRQELVPLRLYPRPHVPLLAPLHVAGVAALGELEVGVHHGHARDLLRGIQTRTIPLVIRLHPGAVHRSDVHILERGELSLESSLRQAHVTHQGQRPATNLQSHKSHFCNDGSCINGSDCCPPPT